MGRAVKHLEIPVGYQHRSSRGKANAGLRNKGGIVFLCRVISEPVSYISAVKDGLFVYSPSLSLSPVQTNDWLYG